jgi:hypothetical protein
MSANANAQSLVSPRDANLIELVERSDHSECAGDRPSRVLDLRLECAEIGEDAVSDELVEGSAMLANDADRCS